MPECDNVHCWLQPRAMQAFLHVGLIVNIIYTSSRSAVRLQHPPSFGRKLHWGPNLLHPPQSPAVPNRMICSYIKTRYRSSFRCLPLIWNKFNSVRLKWLQNHKSNQLKMLQITGKIPTINLRVYSFICDRICRFDLWMTHQVCSLLPSSQRCFWMQRSRTCRGLVWQERMRWKMIRCGNIT